ncbi:MAG TPA: hypothetical protein VH853_18300 [Polyangia bacterium]|jgi:hypothetical protein|nr:hypothetical protein [Polyangia bacterium]
MTWRDFRLVPPIETYPRVVALAQTKTGKLVVLAAFVTMLSRISPAWLPIGSFLVLTTLLPGRRRAVVAVGTVFWAFIWPARAGMSANLLVGEALVFLFGGGLYAASRSFAKSPLFARPVVLLLTLTTTYLAIVGARPGLFRADGLAWAVAHALCNTQWFIAYALIDRSGNPAEPAWKQVGTFAPFWGSTATPFPKGAANWRKIEAGTPEALAVSQLKGLKLLLWCALIEAAHLGFNWVAYRAWGIPSITEARRAIAQNTPFAVGMSWASIFCNFAERLFSLTVFGHIIIACCRMAGFAALRNTYRPLESRSVADFWNRYYYYYKELLVQFFYYPAFLRYFKRRPRLRRIFAVFSTAGFGNVYYHLFRDDHWIQQNGIVSAVRQMNVYAIQCLLLSVAICISQAGRAAPPARGWLRGRLLPLGGVVVSYCLMFVFVDDEFQFPLRVHARFFASLFGIDV